MDTFFSLNEQLKYNALTNLVLSDRSDGKTFDIKVRGFLNWLKDGSQFVYLRRWKSEISCDMYETFYNEVIDKAKANEIVGDTKINEILNYEFLHAKRGVYIRKKGNKKYSLLCYFMALTMTSKKKSSLDIKHISNIEYDEFIPLDGRYAPKEMTLLLEFYKSVDRDRDKTLLNIYGNKIDNFNPFFDFFDIHLSIQKEKIRLYKNGTISVQIYANKEHREKRANSRFAEMVKDTQYEDYSKGGILYNQRINIGNGNGCSYFSSFKSQFGEGSIYTSANKIFISSKQRKDGNLIVDKIYNTDREEYLATFGNLPQMFKSFSNRGKIFYDCEKTFHFFEPILNKMGCK